MSILTSLVEYWPFDEGTGDVANGALGAIDLNLTNLSVDPSDYWEVGGIGFCGQAQNSFPVEWEIGKNIGDSLTLAVECWYDGVRIAPWPGGKPEPVGESSGSAVRIGAIGGVGITYHTAVFHVTYNPPGNVSNADHCYQGAGVGTHDGVNGARGAPPWGSGGPYVLFIEQTRTRIDGGRTRLYWADQAGQVNNDGDSDWSDEASSVYLGVADNVTTVLRAAMWRRVLTSGERAGLVSLAGLAAAIVAGDPSQGVDGEGNSAIVFDFPVEHVLPLGAGDVISSAGVGSGAHRHTRRQHGREIGGGKPLAYGLTLALASGAEVERLRTILAASGGGAQVVRWRHPRDDAAGTPDTAPWYRMSIESIHRGAGGANASARVVMARM